MPKKDIPTTVEGVYKDLRKLFEVQFTEFVKQFVEASEAADLDAFFEDADKNHEFLENIINSWCEKQEPETKDDLDATTAIFMMAFLEAADKATAVEAEGESVEPNPLG
jgi:hypothetical protein